MEIALQGTLVAQRSKQFASTEAITEGYLREGMFELGFEGWLGVQWEEKGRDDGHPSQREMQLSPEKMGSVHGMLTVSSRSWDSWAILKVTFDDCGHGLKSSWWV